MEVNGMRQRRLGDKTKNLHVRLTPIELEQLDMVAKKTGKTKTDVIRECIRMKFNLSHSNVDLDI